MKKNANNVKTIYNGVYNKYDFSSIEYVSDKDGRAYGESQFSR